MDYKITRTSGEEQILHSDARYEAEKYRNSKRNFDHTFFGSNGVSITHHGVKGMKWGVHNEETKQKYGETGSGLEGGGGGLLEDDEDHILTDEEKEKGLIKPTQSVEVYKEGGLTNGDLYIKVTDKTGEKGFFGDKTETRRIKVTDDIPDGFYKGHKGNVSTYDRNHERDVSVKETTPYYGINLTDKDKELLRRKGFDV